MNKKNFQLSEQAEVRYYPGGGVNVDNFDCSVEVEEKEFHARVKITKDGDVEVAPFGDLGTHKGPRSRTICDTGVAKIKKSPKGQNVKVEILLSIDIASERNFRHHLTEVFEKFRETGVELADA